MSNTKIELHLPYVDHRGNQYPRGVYDEDALPKRVKELSEDRMTIHHGNKNSKPAVEEKELYEGKREEDVKVKTKEVKPKQTKKASAKKQDQTPKEQNPTKTHKVNKIEEQE